MQPNDLSPYQMLEAAKIMARWLYVPSERPKEMMVSPESQFRMLEGFLNPTSDYREFAFKMAHVLLDANRV